jgi:hypothetical protein
MNIRENLRFPVRRKPLVFRVFEALRANAVQMNGAAQGSPGARPVGHLVVVSGLKASGKTTFLNSLASRSLSPEIEAALPDDTARWRSVVAEQSDYWLPEVRRGIGGLVLHYDLYRLVRHGPTDAAAETLRLAKSLTLVNIRPPIERLIAQFSARSAKEARRKLLGRGAEPGSPIEAGKAIALRTRILEQYATPGFAEKVYTDWDSLVAAAEAPGDLSIVEIAPAGTAEAPGWVLLSRA